MKLWIIPFSNCYKYISSFEEEVSKGLPKKKSYIYRFTRGYLRFCLSRIFSLPCEDIPIFSLPGKPPTLPNKYGYVSMSHTNNTLLIGWSINNIGVDIENINRNINVERILKSKWFKHDQERIKSFNDNDMKKEILKTWVIKEALVKSHFGSIIRDYDDWLIKNEFIAENYKLKISRKISHKIINNLTIAIAYDESILFKPEIIEFL